VIVITVIVVALGALAYTYVGYPVLIALAARLRPLRVHRDARFTPKVTALIPVYNARDYVAAKLDSLLAQNYPVAKLEILVCSDASNDGSDEVVKAFADRDPRVRLLRSPERRGKPHAVNLMRQHASGEVLLMTDIRQPLDPGCVRALMSTLADPRVACVSGNLVLRGQTGAGLYWKYESWIRRSEAGFRSMVGVTGPIYAIRAADMADMPRDLILDDMWVPMRLRLQQRLITLSPEALAFDQAFADERELGRKVRTLAGNYQLFARMPRLVVPVLNPSWFETFSHKLMRLVCPWALVALALASVSALSAPPPALAPSLRIAVAGLVAGQAGFYGVAALGDRAGALGRVARTFVVLNYAAVAGLWRYLRGAQKVTW
jgi:cellulose synthase/poly-beta-1,6-N-acetylglucosamine synthase-like glycosyltransferase